MIDMNDLEADVGKLRYLIKDGEEILQRYEWRGKPNGCIGWFDVPKIPRVVTDDKANARQ